MYINYELSSFFCCFSFFTDSARALRRGVFFHPEVFTEMCVCTVLRTIVSLYFFYPSDRRVRSVVVQYQYIYIYVYIHIYRPSRSYLANSDSCTIIIIWPPHDDHHNDHVNRRLTAYPVTVHTHVVLLSIKLCANRGPRVYTRSLPIYIYVINNRNSIYHSPCTTRSGINRPMSRESTRKCNCSRIIEYKTR